MKPAEFLDLLCVAFENITHNTALHFRETLRFGGQGWWWKLSFLIWLSYLYDPPYRVISRYLRSHDIAEDNLIYGETPLVTVEKFLEFLKPGPCDVFIDLGCGRGLPVFYAHMLSGVISRGLDIVPEFIERAAAVSSRLSLDRVSFVNSSFRDADISDGTLFYMAGTTFDDSLVYELTEKLERITHPIRLITLSAPLASARFRLVTKMELDFSWGKTWAFFQQSSDDE